MHSSIFSIPISGNITLQNESAHETDHKIHIFVGTSVDYDKHSNGVFQHNLVDGTFNHVLHFTKAVEQGTAICVDLFATTSNFRGASACKRIATATIPIHSLQSSQTIPMLQNVIGVHKADMSLDTSCDLPKLDKVSIASSMEPDNTELVLAEAVHEDRQKTIYTVRGYSQFINRIRMVPFQTRTVCVPGTAFWDMKTLDITDSALMQWLEDACHRHSTTVEDWSRLVKNGATDAVVGAVLGTVCTLYPNTCTYIGDFVWKGNKKLDFDSYESIGTTGSGDCEDLAHGMIQVFNAISDRITARFSYGPLDALTDVSHRYVCVAALGEANKASVDNVFASGGCAHMWAMLLPRHEIDTHTHASEDDTCLLLEGTARVHPNIKEPMSRIFSQVYLPEQITRINYIEDMSFYTRVAHVYPSKPVEKARTFGYTVVSPAPISKNELAVYGVTMDDMYRGKYALWKHTEFNKTTRKAIKKVMAFEHPHLHLVEKHDTHCENEKYLLNNLTKKMVNIGPETETETFFVDTKDLSKSVCDKFVNNIDEAHIKITNVSTRVEFNNVLCIKLTGYVC